MFTASSLNTSQSRWSLSTLVVVALTVLFSAAPAHALKVIENLEGQPIPNGLSTSQVKKTMVVTGGRRGWLIREVGPNHMEATLNVRKHTVVVDIRLSGGSYAITYKTSVNMKYDGVGKIHGRYNKWVATLNRDFQAALLAASYN